MKRKILFVCLGNICRSPAAEGLFVSLLQKKGILADFDVDSAGTGSWHVGNPADQRMVRAAKSRGVIIDSVARQIQTGDFFEFDYIITMDNDNLNTVLSMRKSLDKGAKAIIKSMLSFSSFKDFSEVPDPYYGGENGFNLVLDLLEDACIGLYDEISSSM